jgi:hypothetical protein
MISNRTADNRKIARLKAISLIVAVTFITCPGTNFTVE